MAEAFGVEVDSGYGYGYGYGYGTSDGLHGSTTPGSPVFTLTGDMAVAELVDADNQPVSLGTESAKVLVTNLYNHTQPLIRYDLSDRMIRQPDATEHGHP